MSQTPLQDPVDLVQTNETGHETTNTERMLSPNSISTQEDPSNPTSTQEDPPTTNTKRLPSSTPTPTQEDPPTSHQPEVLAHEPSQDTSTQSRSSPPIAVPSSKTDISSEPPTGTNAIPDGQDTQLDQTQLPNEDLGISKDPLDAYDWAELEERFDAAMEKCAVREEGIQEEFNELINVCSLLPTHGDVSITTIYTEQTPALQNIYSHRLRA